MHTICMLGMAGQVRLLSQLHPIRAKVKTFVKDLISKGIVTMNNSGYYLTALNTKIFRSE